MLLASCLSLKINPLLEDEIRSKLFQATTIKRRPNNSEDLIVKIKERMNGKVEISPSAYDTAWVAMVPAREYSCREPLFPACLDWIVEHQNPDGSWGLHSPPLLKDSLSCTLACLLALRKWNVAVADQLIFKGLEFIRTNASVAIERDDQLNPIGFDVVFPTMLQYAKDMDLTLSIDQDLLDIIIRNRDSHLKKNKNLEYVGEGLGNSIDLKKMLMLQQRSNGSLFNSPAITAAALIQFHDDKCLAYLSSALSLFKTWVPTIYPVDVYARLCLVDHLQDLGVDRFFQSEIDTILNETLRLWEQRDDQIFRDVTCRAMAFRLLRLKGYHVSPDELVEYVDEDNYFDAVSLESKGIDTVLELYKASHVRLPEDDVNDTLQKLHDWTYKFLMQQLRCKAIVDKQLERKVEFNLKNYHGILDAVKYRRNVELYDVNNIRILKAAYRCPTIYNDDIFQLAAQDFMSSQSQNQKELQMLERWYEDCRLDKMKYGRNVIRVSHFLNANNFPDPQLSEARLAFAKTMTLVTRLDDFFDHHGSRDHSLLIIDLIRQWKEPSTVNFPCEEVEILYSALHTTVTDIADKAYPMQGRCIKSLIIHLWVEILSSFMNEMDSCTAEIPPDIHEYLSFAWISIGCRICILVAIHFLGLKVSEELVMGPECTQLCRHVSSIARLLNDLQTFKKEREERKLNSVIIQLNADGISEEEAVSNIEKMVEYHRKQLLKLVLKRERSVVPRKCKDVFWKSCNIGYYLYTFTDEFSSPQQMKEDMKLLFRDPLNNY